MKWQHPTGPTVAGWQRPAPVEETVEGQKRSVRRPVAFDFLIIIVLNLNSIGYIFC